MAFYLLPKKKKIKTLRILSDDKGNVLKDYEGVAIRTTIYENRLCWLWWCFKWEW